MKRVKNVKGFPAVFRGKEIEFNYFEKCYNSGYMLHFVQTYRMCSNVNYGL